MAEDLELVVPGLAEGKPEFAVQFEGVGPCDLHGVAHAILGDDDVAGRVSLGVEDAEVGRVQPAAAVTSGGRILGHLEAQVLPAAQGGGEARSGALGALPVVLGAHGALEHGLDVPVEVDGAIERATGRPLDVGAQGLGRGVDEQHSARWCSSHDFSIPSGATSPSTCGWKRNV